MHKFLPTRFPPKCPPPGALTNPIEEGGDTYIVRDANGIDFTVRASAALVAYNATNELFAGSGPGDVFVTRKHSGWLMCMRDINGFDKLPMAHVAQGADVGSQRGLRERHVAQRRLARRRHPLQEPLRRERKAAR